MKFYRLTAALTAALLVLTGCSAATEKMADGMAADMEYFSMETSAAADYGYTGGSNKAQIYYDAMEAPMEMEESMIEAEEMADESGAVNDLSARKIIKTANLEFESKTYDEFMATLEKTIAQSGGYISNQSARGGGEYAYNPQRYANLTVRIPASSYDRFMEQAAALGSLTYKSESAEDVTMSYVDTESHIRALETEYDALLTILEKAENLNDVIQLQARITEVNYQLDRYKAQLRKYDDLIAYCTVHISVNEVYRETKNVEVLTFGQRIVTALENTFYNISDDAQDFTVDFIAALPYLLIWAVIIVLAILILRILWKKLKRKHEIRKLDKLCKQAEEKKDNENT